MKRFFITAAIVAIFSIAAHAQKYALVDMEYILKNIPQYEMANEQLNQVSLRWQKEVEAKSKEAETLYKNYQNDIYEAIKKLSEEKGYQAIFDRASSAGIIFASPRIDVSNDVLAKLGYSK